MDPVTMALIGGLVAAGSGAISEWLGSAANERERTQRMLALREYSAIAPPEHRELVAREVARSRMGDVRRDAGLEATQDEVLARTLEVGRTGESAQARADYEQAAMDSAQRARSDRMAAVSAAVARGLGPEASFTDSLLAGQADADRERMAGIQRAAHAEQARMGALADVGGMAERRSSTRWNQDAEVAQAQDELDMFNAGQWNDMQRYNDQSRYDAFDAQLARADRMARARGEVADMHERQGQRTREQVGNIGTGASRAITAPGVYAPSGGGAMAPKQTPRPTTYGGVGANAALAPALEQQRQLLTSTPPTTTATRRRAR